MEIISIDLEECFEYTKRERNKLARKPNTVTKTSQPTDSPAPIVKFKIYNELSSNRFGFAEKIV